VVAKPAGLQVLPAGPFSEHTLLQLVQGSAPQRAQSSPVHRLGRGTSGLVLFGKTRAARAELSRQFRECSALKTYFGLVEGTSLPRSAVAAHPIGRLPVGRWQTFAVAAGGLPSVTRVRVLARDEAARRSLVAAQPITGRPNQIRIHLAALGAPLVGDPLFAPGGGLKSTAKPAEGGYYLHAAGLGFVHPATGRWTKLRSRPGWL
jgi:23S rRNA pseudouridine1911/1915/1917 synthase